MQETQFQDIQRLNRTLNGQRVVLIGGTSGFGFATAKAAVREGASISTGAMIVVDGGGVLV